MKISNLNDYLISIAIGVRYRANFSIEDQLGKIVDQILYSQDSFFNPKVFPIVRNNVVEKRLVNEATSDSMLINNSNIILEVFFGKTFVNEDFDSIVQNFHRQIIEGILKEYKVTQIVRLGFIKRYVFQIEDLAKTFINKTIGSTLEGINDINLSFSKKIPTPNSLLEKSIMDYDNLIFNIIKKSDLKELYTAIDYQRYFDPFLNSASKMKFKEFCDRVNDFNDNSYLDWINTNYISISNE